MTYVHVGKTPVPQRIPPSFSNEVFYPGSAPAGVTPQYFTTLNVYQQWLQIFGPDVPLPEDERNLPGYPQNNLYTATGEEGPRYRYCSKERVWKPRTNFPMSNCRFLSTCSRCKDVDIRRAAKRQGKSLENSNEDSFQGIQPNQNVTARFSKPSMPIANTDHRKHTVANLPLMPKAKPYTAEPLRKHPIPAPVIATPALGPSEETIARLNELEEMQFDAKRIQSRLLGHENVKKQCEAKLEDLMMAINCVSEGNRGKSMTETARLQDRISTLENILNEIRSELEDVNLAIGLMAEMNKDNTGYQNNNEPTVLPSIEEENVGSFNSPNNFDNTSEAGVEFAGETNDLLRFSPMPHSYPPLDDDGHVLSNNDPFEQSPKFASGLDSMVEKDHGDGTSKVNMNSPLHTLNMVGAGALHADPSIMLQDQDTVDKNFQQLHNFRTKNPQAQKEVDHNRFRALSVSREVPDQHAQSYQAQSRQPSASQRFQFHTRTPSKSRYLDPHLPHQASAHISSHLQPQKATNDAAQCSPLPPHTPGLNLNLFGNHNPTAVFQFGKSTTLRDSRRYGVEIEEDVGGVQTLASQQKQEPAQEAQPQQEQQFQPVEMAELVQLAQKATDNYDKIARRARMDQESQKVHDELAQEQLSQPTRVVQQPKQACDQLAQSQMVEEQLAQNAKDIYKQHDHEQRAQEQRAKEELAQPIELFQLAKQACGRLAQDQLSQKRRSERARDSYDQLAYEKRTRQNEATCDRTLAHDQMDQDELYQDELYQGEMDEYEMGQYDMDQDQLAQKAMHARDVYDKIAHEKRTRQNESTAEANVACEQLDQDQMDPDEMVQDEMYQDQLAEDQLAQKARDARDVYDQLVNEIRDRKNELAEHVHHAHYQLSRLSQQTQLAQQEQQELRAQKAEYQARRQRQPLESLPNFHSLPIREAQPNQSVETAKRRADESPKSPESPLQHEPEHPVRRFKRARHGEETETEMQERGDRHAKPVERRAEIWEMQQIEKATELSVEDERRCEKG
ncbi:uncharacterized protein EAF01_004590 [Botrytis porri]|uniref:uncharacterized protein n=1 Tax=Botrytis porri TaxID=87229 RepID=UPI0018FF63CE|nr:uncharacterized protein EAF01_004590 [Botrytis porri]KAF7907003.1 hypothetical protein EAF01_004590 [Botrytis porri]